MPRLARANEIAWAVTLAGCWFWSCRQLSLAWSSSPNYEFGYFVPWIGLLLAYRRVRDNPGCFAGGASGGGWAGILAGLGIFCAWGCFLVAELLREFDPHWRMVGWVMMGAVTLLTGIALWRRGGMRLVSVLAFPLAFMWTAVPWPTKVEEVVTLGLRSFVTGGAVTALHAMGILAAQQGNVINLAGGSVVVDSACSGISSLQVTIMASLFLGEYFRFRAARRMVLLGMGALLAVAANLARATALVRIASDHGGDALLAWHDRIGYAETGGIFAGLVLVAWGLSWRAKKAGRGVVAAAVAGVRAPSGGWEGCAALTAFAGVPLIASAWFAVSPGGPIRQQNAPMWVVQSHPVSAGWHVEPVVLPDMDLETLAYDEGQTIALDGPGDESAVIYHFFWKTDASTGYGHTPDHCMAGAGWEEVGEPVAASVRVGGCSFPGKFYRFRRDGGDEVVFQSVWYGGDPMLSSGEFPYAKGGRGARGWRCCGMSRAGGAWNR